MPRGSGALAGVGPAWRGEDGRHTSVAPRFTQCSCLPFASGPALALELRDFWSPLFQREKLSLRRTYEVIKANLEEPGI